MIILKDKLKANRYSKMTKTIKITLIAVFLFSVLCTHAQSTKIDSLRNPHSNYYMTDLDLRDVARLMLEDSIHPMDNTITFSILDSVTAGNQSTREYFAEVFALILNRSDGALSEVMGIYCIASIYNNPNELLQWLSSGKLEVDLESVAGYISYELVMSEDPHRDKKELIKRIKDDAKNTSLVKYADDFIAIIEKEFERQMDE